MTMKQQKEIMKSFPGLKKQIKEAVELSNSKPGVKGSWLEVFESAYQIEAGRKHQKDSKWVLVTGQVTALSHPAWTETEGSFCKVFQFA